MRDRASSRTTGFTRAAHVSRFTQCESARKGVDAATLIEYINLPHPSSLSLDSRLSSPFSIQRFLRKRGGKRDTKSFHFKDNLQAQPRSIPVVIFSDELKFISVSSLFRFIFVVLKLKAYYYFTS